MKRSSEWALNPTVHILPRGRQREIHRNTLKSRRQENRGKTWDPHIIAKEHPQPPKARNRCDSLPEPLRDCGPVNSDSGVGQ